MVTLELPQNLGCYIASAFLASLIVRFFLSFLRWSESWFQPSPKSSYWTIFIGFGGARDQNDYFQPFVVGFLELLVYPVLLSSGVPGYIGAWLGFKVVPVFGAWAKHRQVYQRFLVGNAMVVIFSFVLYKCFYA